jgi:hypothetical protein
MRHFSCGPDASFLLRARCVISSHTRNKTPGTTSPLLSYYCTPHSTPKSNTCGIPRYSQPAPRQAMALRHMRGPKKTLLSDAFGAHNLCSDAVAGDKPQVPPVLHKHIPCPAESVFSLGLGAHGQGFGACVPTVLRWKRPRLYIEVQGGGCA